MVRRVLLAIIGLLLLNPISARSQTATPTPPPGGGSGLLLYITKTDDGAEVFSSTVDGEQRTQLTTSRNPKLYPQWSPDGKQFLYEEIVGRVSAVFVKAADADAAPKNIVNGSYPRWMPDGKQIILAIDGGGTSIYVKNADGTGGNQIIQRAPTARDSRTYPAPGGLGGDVLAFAGKSGTAGTYELYMTGDNNRLTTLTQNNTDDRYPVWSPDGDKIAYANSKGQICLIQISMITRTITSSICFPNSIAENSCPGWSPDSTQITFVSKLYDEYKYYVMNVDGTSVYPLLEDPAYVYEQPDGFIRCSPVSWR